MPSIKNIHPGSPEPLGPTVLPDGINFAVHSAGRDPDRAAPLRQRDRPAAQRRSSRSRPRPTGRATSGTSSSRGCPTGPSTTTGPTGPTTRPPTAPGSTPPRPCSTPTPRRSPATSTGGPATPWATTTPRPTDPDRHLRPSDGDERRGGRAVRGLQERLRLGGGPPPRHPDRELDHLRGPRPGLHPPPLVRERHGRDLSRVHRQDPPPQRAGDHRGRADADHGVRPVRRPVPRPVHRRAADQRLGLQHDGLLRPRVALQLLRQGRRAGRRVQDARPRAAQEQHRGDPRRGLQPHPRGEPLRPDDELQGAGQQHLLHALAQARVLHGLHRLRQHDELQPPGGPQVHPRLPPLLGHGDARQRLPVRPGGGLRHRRRPAGEGEDADHPRDRDRPGPLADQADRRALEHHPVSPRLVLRPAMGRVERQVPRHRPQVGQGGHRRRRRAGRPGHRLLRPLRQQRGGPADPVTTASTSSPATTASRSTTSSRSTRSTTSGTARTTATGPTTTRAGTAATRGSSSCPTCPTRRRRRSRTSAASRSRTS